VAFRYRVLHLAARITRGARQQVVSLVQESRLTQDHRIERSHAQRVVHRFRCTRAGISLGMHVAFLRNGGTAMRFSEHFGVTPGDDDDWFDPLLNCDTRLYVDPFLIYLDQDATWQGAHQRLIEFFALALQFVKDANGDKQSLAWKKAAALLLFPEPYEFALGLSFESTIGLGSGRILQRAMLDGADATVRLGIDSIDHMELLVLFGEGIGLDRISDMVCNVLKEIFIEYTQDICRRLDIPMQKRAVRHSSWSDDHGMWLDMSHDLPVNPHTNRPTLLVPSRFLRPFTTADQNDFWNYAWAHNADDLRTQFNYDVASKVSSAMKARMARANPEAAIAYLKSLETKPQRPYDLNADPHVNWPETAAAIAKASPLAFVPTNPDEFAQFVRAVIESFSHGLEEQDLARALWYKGRFTGEKTVQAIFRNTALHYCRANQIVFSAESDGGRGPVDFKFAQNWEAQAIIEVKLTSSTSYWHGLNTQTPQYMVSEEVHLGFFVSVGIHDKDFEQENMQTVTDAAKAVSERIGKDLQVVFVDARIKPSASKKPPESTKDDPTEDAE